MSSVFIPETDTKFSNSGGSVLSAILSSGDIRPESISVLVRGNDKAEVFNSKGVKAILFNGLDEDEKIQEIASEDESKQNICCSNFSS